MLPDWMVSALRTAGGSVSDAASAARGAIGGAASTVGGWFGGGSDRDPADDVARSGGRSGATVQARTEATLQVPQGTSEEQRRAIEAQTEQIFAQHWDREIRSALWDFQPVD